MRAGFQKYSSPMSSLAISSANSNVPISGFRFVFARALSTLCADPSSCSDIGMLLVLFLALSVWSDPAPGVRHGSCEHRCSVHREEIADSGMRRRRLGGDSDL